MENTAAWALQPQAVRQEREATLNQSRRIVQSDLTLANVHVRMMQYTTTKVCVFRLPIQTPDSDSRFRLPIQTPNSDS
jgi:hypothetical protein